jgi:hypothetical protein
VTFFSESTEKDARTSARVLLRGTIVVSAGTAPLPLVTTGDGAAAGAFFALSSSAQDFGGDGFGGDPLGVSSASALESVPATAPSSTLAAEGDLTDFCVVEVALGGFADLKGMSGIAGIVAVRVCFVVVDVG